MEEVARVNKPYPSTEAGRAEGIRSRWARLGGITGAVALSVGFALVAGCGRSQAQAEVGPPKASVTSTPSAESSSAPATAAPPSSSKLPSPASTASPAPTKAPSPGPSPSPSQAPVDLEQQRIKEILQKTGGLNQKLKDYTAEMEILLELKAGFLKLPVTLEGQYFYKAPDRVRMVLRKAPALLSKYPQIFGQRPIRMEDHRVTQLADDKIDGRPVWVLRFDKKDQGSDYRGQTVYIDQQTYVQPRHIYNYKNDGRIEVNLSWMQRDGFWLLSQVVAVLDFPKHGASATATAHYKGYAINSGLDDAVFDGKAAPTKP
jgi:hypothetical protein